MYVEVTTGRDFKATTYHCSTCKLQCESIEELRDHLNASGEMPDVKKLLVMDVESAIKYALKFPKWYVLFRKIEIWY